MESMRKVSAKTIEDTVCRLILEANFNIGEDIYQRVCAAQSVEPSPIGSAVLEQLRQNYDIARQEQTPICQDTGMAVVFIWFGQRVQVTDGSFAEAIQQGVRRAYDIGLLRKSVVDDPLYDRKNTGDNTPAVVHTEITDSDQIEILVTPKGFGSENMGGIAMLTAADGEKGVVDFVVQTVRKAGPNPCPPIVVGVGIGGTMEKAAQLAKLATARSIDRRNPDPRYAALEDKLLEQINRTGIGPAGLGGHTTGLAVNVEHFPTHIAGMPVAVNICCHAARHAFGVI